MSGYTWQCGLKYTDIRLQTLQDKEIVLLLKKNIPGNVNSVMGNRYVEPDDNRKILCIDANKLYGNSMSQSLPYDEIKFDKNVQLEDILHTPDDSFIGYFVEVDLKYQYEIKEETEKFPFCPEKNICLQDNFGKFMRDMKPIIHTKNETVICDWTDRKKYLIHYRMLNFHVRHGIVVNKIHEIISFKQSKWL